MTLFECCLYIKRLSLVSFKAVDFEKTTRKSNLQSIWINNESIHTVQETTTHNTLDNDLISQVNSHAMIEKILRKWEGNLSIEGKQIPAHERIIFSSNKRYYDWKGPQFDIKENERFRHSYWGQRRSFVSLITI